MKVKRAVFMAVLVVAVAALAVPLLGLRAAASGSGAPITAKSRSANAATPVAQQSVQVEQKETSGESRIQDAQASSQGAGAISAETLRALGIKRVADPKAATEKIAQHLQNKGKKSSGDDVSIQSGTPINLDGRSALSDALITTLGGRDNQFSEVALIADWDGREDCVADREQKVDDFTGFEAFEPDQELTRTAISEHTVANGFNENVYYYGDSIGNLWIGTDTNPGQPGLTGVGGGPTGIGAQIDVFRTVNIPQLFNLGASGGFTLGAGITTGGTGITGCMDDQVVVTGIAVNPVADLCDFGLGGVIGEIIYVSVTDTEGCASNTQPVIGRASIIEFAVRDIVGGVAPVGVRRIFVSTLANFAGVAVDDDGSLYFQLLDIINFTGGAIMKFAELPRTTCGGAACISRVIPVFSTIITSINVWQGSTANPIAILNGIRATNYSGPSTLFGDIIAIASGPCNVLYAAVSSSFVSGPVSFDQLAQGLFPAPAAFGAAGTPSMVISFADCSGLVDICSGIATIGNTIPPTTTNLGGTLPVGNGIADVVSVAAGALIPGVNNFRVFVQGAGPAIANTNPVVGLSSTAIALKITELQVDYVPAHAGLAISQEGTVFVISGGAPAGVGKSPSPMVGEVLCFEDACPADRRADPTDIRTTNVFPAPATGAGNTGDGKSDRFDHIFYQAPLDVNTATPAGMAGLNFGFLRYTNRLAINPMGGQVVGAVLNAPDPLGVTKGILGDDDTEIGNIIFEFLDPGHQVAGGDDQIGTFRGDDDNGAGNTGILATNIPPVPNSSATGTLLNGGFEFIFGGPVGTQGCVWNGVFMNSNGNITFGTGDTSFKPTVPAFRTGLPKIAAAWADLNPSSRLLNCGTFPVMAVGFANVNAFKIRWINVPEVGSEACTAGVGANAANPLGVGGASNTFSITLYDDGTGIDENANQPLNPANPIGNNSVAFDLFEGATDNRFTTVALAGGATPATFIVGCPPRKDGSGIFVVDYCRMDLLGTATRPVISGYSIGGLSPLNPPGLCEVDLHAVALAAEQGAFGLLPGNQIAAVGCNCCIGEGTEPTIFELFNEGKDASTGSGGEITFAKPDFDLRFEGNDAALCTSTRQRDLNKGKICYLGIGCAAPANPFCIGAAVIPGAFVPTPTSTGVVNALCAVTLNVVGCGFYPTEGQTTVCQGFAEDTGVPLQRPGKTVTNAATLSCDTNGDGLFESVVVLGSVTPVNCNLVTAVLNPSASFGATSTSGFPAACCGGPAFVTVTTTVTGVAGQSDNNIFGPFTRSAVCSLALGTRAPVVFSVTPSSGDCSLPDQDLLISGACFSFVESGPFGTGGATTTRVDGVTSVFAQDITNSANVIQAKTFVVLTPNLIDAHFFFGSANAGKTFLIFVVGPGGTSRNLTTLPTGAPAGCATGNEQGIQVTFKCNNPGTPTTGPTPDIAVVQTCHLDRQDTGQFFLDVTGANIKDGATVTVGGVTPKKIKVVEVAPGTTNPTKLRLIKKVCNGLPGNVIITNPGANGGPSQPLLCTERCPAE